MRRHRRSHPSRPPLTPDDGQRQRREHGRLGQPPPAIGVAAGDEPAVGVGQVRPRRQREEGGAGSDDRRHESAAGRAGPRQPPRGDPNRRQRGERRQPTGRPDRRSAARAGSSRDGDQVVRARRTTRRGGIEVQGRQDADPDHRRREAQDNDDAVGQRSWPAGRVAEHHPRDESRAQRGEDQPDREHQRRAGGGAVPLAEEPDHARREEKQRNRTTSPAPQRHRRRGDERPTGPQERENSDPRSLSERVRGGCPRQWTTRRARPRAQPRRGRAGAAPNHRRAARQGFHRGRPLPPVGVFPQSCKRDEGVPPAPAPQSWTAAPMCAEPGTFTIDASTHRRCA